MRPAVTARPLPLPPLVLLPPQLNTNSPEAFAVVGFAFYMQVHAPGRRHA
jgi:hypothetical protein